MFKKWISMANVAKRVSYYYFSVWSEKKTDISVRTLEKILKKMD